MKRSDLVKLAPRAGKNADLYLPHLIAAMAEAGIVAPLDKAGFLANVIHETGDFSRVSEGLNYSAKRLREVWPTRFTNDAIAHRYAHNPEALANFVYANREGNGNAASGDGWRFRGAGGIQLTFRNNQAKAAEHFGIPIDRIGDWLRSPEGAMRSAAWFWKRAGCSKMMAAGDFDGACDLVNIGRKTAREGDSIGFDHRAKIFNIAKGMNL